MSNFPTERVSAPELTREGSGLWELMVIGVVLGGGYPMFAGALAGLDFGVGSRYVRVVGEERSFGERVEAQVDADLELASRSRLPEEDRQIALAVRAGSCDFGDLGEQAIVDTAVPLMGVVGEFGYRTGEELGMFGPLGGAPKDAIGAIAGRYEGTSEERGRLLAEAVAAGLEGRFMSEGDETLEGRFDAYWAEMQGMLGNEPRLDAPARELFEFGAAMYAVETTIVLELIRNERYAKAAEAIKRDERGGRRWSWRRRSG